MDEQNKPVTESGENSEMPEDKDESQKEESKQTGEQIDYQKLYEEEKTRRAKAESIIQRHKKKPKEELDEEEISESNIDPDIIRETIREELDTFKSTISSQLRGREINDLINRFTTDPKEAALVRYHYENSIRQTGDLELDMENAKALANKHKVNAKLEEMKAALISKDTKSSGSGSGRKVEAEQETKLPFLTDIDRKIIGQLRKSYVLSNDAVRRILNGEKINNLLSQGIVKKR